MIIWNGMDLIMLGLFGACVLVLATAYAMEKLGIRPRKRK
jgi:hypothetical protein